MFLPDYYRSEDRARILRFLRQYPTGQLVTALDGKAFATPLPFFFEEGEEGLRLVTHLAAANEQTAEALDGCRDALALFTGPSAYVTPRLYEREQSVPTWNYVSVQIRGTISVLREDGPKRQRMRDILAYFDPEYLSQYDRLSPKYVDALFGQLTMLEMEAEQIDATFKLSQDKSERDRANIAEAFRASQDPTVQALAVLQEEGNAYLRRVE